MNFGIKTVWHKFYPLRTTQKQRIFEMEGFGGEEAIVQRQTLPNVRTVIVVTHVRINTVTRRPRVFEFFEGLRA